VERSIRRGEKRDERRDKVAAERFARTKHPETALKHETGLLRKEHGKKADTHIDKTLKPVYERAREIKDKREARRDKRLGDAHRREFAKHKPWKKGDKKPYPGWSIKGDTEPIPTKFPFEKIGPSPTTVMKRTEEAQKKWDKQWEKSQQRTGSQYDRHRRRIDSVPAGPIPTTVNISRAPSAADVQAGVDRQQKEWEEKRKKSIAGWETKEEYVARLGQRGTTPEGYSVHIPHHLHEASTKKIEAFLKYKGKRMDEEEKAWRKRTAHAKWKSDLRRERLRERNKWYV
jgi:hypothetical protein|tara:strand:- start:75 stop:935 length:861 start_codon:yes stop_codon:yes gene_type:complete